MADYKKLIPFIKKWEGGFVNDPADIGGATYKGVTINTYKRFCSINGLPEPTLEKFKEMPENHWNEIFKSMYWDRWKADFIKSQSIANILVDWVWASGVYGIKRPQELVGVNSDGMVGIKTLAAINDRNPEQLFQMIKQARLDFIDEICKKRPANIKFRNGWINRVNDIKNTR